MAAQIVDPFGYPVSSKTGGYGGRDRLYEVTRARWRNKHPNPERLNYPLHRLVNYYDWNTIVSASRNLVANFPILDGAITTKAMHSVGRAWNPVFMGDDEEWGDKASEWLLDEWYRICNVRGENYDLKTSLYVASTAIDTDGDFACILTETDGGYPKIQFLTCDRIGMRDQEEIIADGPYKGFRCQLGVIYSSYGEPIAFNFLGDSPETDQQIAARDVIFRFDPRFFDQGRGLPSLRGSLLFIDQSRTSHMWEHEANMMASAIGLIEYNDAGAADPNEPGALMGTAATAGDSGAFSTERFEGGMIRYFRSGSGQKLEQMQNSRPGEDWERFHDRTIRIALAELGWPYSLTWKPDGMNGTQERSEIEKARVAIKDRQDLLEPMMQRVCGYAVSKAIKLGRLPQYPGDDVGGFLKWGFTKPAKFSIDPGRDGQSRREDYKLGIRNLESIVGEEGCTYEEHQERRDKETRDVIMRAQAIAADLAIPFGTALSLLQQRTATASAPGGINGALLTDNGTEGGNSAPKPVDSEPLNE